MKVEIQIEWFATVKGDGNPGDVFCSECALSMPDFMVQINTRNLSNGYICPACGKEHYGSI